MHLPETDFTVRSAIKPLKVGAILAEANHGVDETSSQWQVRLVQCMCASAWQWNFCNWGE